MAEFVVKNNIFEFNGKVKYQAAWTVIGIKFAPLYAWFYIDEVENELLKTQELQPHIWFRYADDIFFYMESINFKSNLKCTYQISKDNINFQDLYVSM